MFVSSHNRIDSFISKDDVRCDYALYLVSRHCQPNTVHLICELTKQVLSDCVDYELWIREVPNYFLNIINVQEAMVLSPSSTLTLLVVYWNLFTICNTTKKSPWGNLNVSNRWIRGVYFVLCPLHILITCHTGHNMNSGVTWLIYKFVLYLAPQKL